MGVPAACVSRLVPHRDGRWLGTPRTHACSDYHALHLKPPTVAWCVSPAVRQCAAGPGLAGLRVRLWPVPGAASFLHFAGWRLAAVASFESCGRQRWCTLHASFGGLHRKRHGCLALACMAQHMLHHRPAILRPCCRS